MKEAYPCRFVPFVGGPRDGEKLAIGLVDGKLPARVQLTMSVWETRESAVEFAEYALDGSWFLGRWYRYCGVTAAEPR